MRTMIRLRFGSPCKYFHSKWIDFYSFLCRYLSLYSAIVLLAVVLNMCTYFFYVSGSMRASRVINKALVDSVLTSTLRSVSRSLAEAGPDALIGGWMRLLLHESLRDARKIYASWTVPLLIPP